MHPAQNKKSMKMRMKSVTVIHTTCFLSLFLFSKFIEPKGIQYALESNK